MDHYVRLGCISTPRALKDSLNLVQPTALVQSTRAVGCPRFKLPLSARGVVKCSLTERKSIVITSFLQLSVVALENWANSTLNKKIVLTLRTLFIVSQRSQIRVSKIVILCLRNFYFVSRKFLFCLGGMAEVAGPSFKLSLSARGVKMQPKRT